MNDIFFKLYSVVNPKEATLLLLDNYNDDLDNYIKNKDDENITITTNKIFGCFKKISITKLLKTFDNDSIIIEYIHFLDKIVKYYTKNGKILDQQFLLNKILEIDLEDLHTMPYSLKTFITVCCYISDTIFKQKEIKEHNIIQLVVKCAKNPIYIEFFEKTFKNKLLNYLTRCNKMDDVVCILKNITRTKHITNQNYYIVYLFVDFSLNNKSIEEKIELIEEYCNNRLITENSRKIVIDMCKITSIGSVEDYDIMNKLIESLNIVSELNDILLLLCTPKPDPNGYNSINSTVNTREINGTSIHKINDTSNNYKINDTSNNYKINDTSNNYKINDTSNNYKINDTNNNYKINDTCNNRKTDINYYKIDNDYRKTDNDYYKIDNDYRKTNDNYRKTDNNYHKTDNHYHKPDNKHVSDIRKINDNTFVNSGKFANLKGNNNQFNKIGYTEILNTSIVESDELC